MQYPTPISDSYLQELKLASGGQDGKEDGHPHSTSVPSASSGVVAVAPPAPTKWSSDEAVAQCDLPDVPFRFSEKKRLHWSDKTCTWSLSGSHFG